SPDEFITFLFVIFSIMNPVKELSTVNNRIQEAVAAGQRVFSLMNTEPEIKNAVNAVKINKFRSAIEFEKVYFKYDEKKAWALSDINVQIKKGEILAIVGPSGAGKSTFVDLIPRFYDPSFGVIWLDGFNLREIDIKSLRPLMGIVTQETILFHDTIFNNIAYGLTDISLQDVERAAKIANAHSFISEFPDTYQTLVGERGVKLSGGQRQRIAIARAVLKNPPILILDEATSSLDSESELLVQQAIERLMENRTVFVIAHRLSTILHADRILVLDKGRIVQQGTHDQLINQQGIYQKLYQMQFRA
ncbi:MAG: ABC transporter ATP-binding protein, partial [bacterium]